jgi:hypothetical protein
LFEHVIRKTAAKMSRRGFAAGNNAFGLQRFGLIGHFCVLNPWFTVLQVPDESPKMSGILPLFTRISFSNKSVVAVTKFCWWFLRSVSVGVDRTV